VRGPALLSFSGCVFDDVDVAHPLAGVSVLPGASQPVPAVRLDQPALALAGGPPSPAPLWDDGTRKAIVQFLDGTWRLCRLTAWRRGRGTWVCDLRWGVSGRIFQAAYVYDAARVLRS
jgi:hypothetical protein